MTAQPLPASRSTADWARIRHAAGRVAVVALLVAGMWLWVSSTRPQDPLRPGPGLGFENSGSFDVPVGQARGYSFDLVGTTPRSRATVTGYTLPHIAGVRLRMYAIRGFVGSDIGFPVIRRARRDDPSSAEFRPLVGATLRALPARLGWGGPVLTAVLVVTPLTPGCHRVTGVAVHYRVGGTTFTRSMDGAMSVSTGKRFCD